MSDEKTVVKSAFWYTASNILVRASGFITIPIFTRLLTKAEYGQYNNFLTWVSVIGVVTSMSLESTLISAKYDYKTSFARYVFSISILSMFLAAAWWLIATICMTSVSPNLDLSPTYIHAMFVYLVFQPVVNIFQAYERFQFRYIITVITSMAVSLGAAILSVVLVFIMSDKLAGVIYGRVLPMLLVGLILLFVIAHEDRHLDFGAWFYAIPIALPFIPHLLSMNLLGSLNKIYIIRICGPEANALYSLANNCALVITILTTSLNGAFSPWLGERLALRDYESTRRVGRPYIILFAILSIGVCDIAPEIMYILGGRSYSDAAELIPAIAIGCVFQFAYCMYVNIEQFEKKTVGMAFASMSAAGLNALLDYIFVPRFGYKSAAFATAISYCWLFLVHMFLVFRLDLLHTYDTRTNCLVLIFTSVAMAILYQLYPYLVARIAVGVVLLIAIYRVYPMIKVSKHSN